MFKTKALLAVSLLLLFQQSKCCSCCCPTQASQSLMRGCPLLPNLALNDILADKLLNVLPSRCSCSRCNDDFDGCCRTLTPITGCSCGDSRCGGIGSVCDLGQIDGFPKIGGCTCGGLENFGRCTCGGVCKQRGCSCGGIGCNCGCTDLGKLGGLGALDGCSCGGTCGVLSSSGCPCGGRSGLGLGLGALDGSCGGTCGVLRSSGCTCGGRLGLGSLLCGRINLPFLRGSLNLG